MGLAFDFKDTPLKGHVEITTVKGNMLYASKTKSYLGNTEETVYFIKILVERVDGTKARIIHAFTEATGCAYRQTDCVKVEFKENTELVCPELRLVLASDGPTEAVCFAREHK